MEITILPIPDFNSFHRYCILESMSFARLQQSFINPLSTSSEVDKSSRPISAKTRGRVDFQMFARIMTDNELNRGPLLIRQ